MGKVMAVNISVKRGTQKVNVHTVKLIENYGLENDAHAGNWHRQVSLLSYEKIEEFKLPLENSNRTLIKIKKIKTA